MNVNYSNRNISRYHNAEPRFLKAILKCYSPYIKRCRDVVKSAGKLFRQLNEVTNQVKYRLIRQESLINTLTTDNYKVYSKIITRRETYTNFKNFISNM